MCKWDEYLSTHNRTISRQEYAVDKECFHDVTVSNPVDNQRSMVTGIVL